MQQMLTKREKTILLLALFLIIGAAVFNFLILPVVKKVASLDREINIAQEKLSRYLLLLKQKDYIRERFETLSPGRDWSKDENNTLTGALSEIEAIAKQANIRIIDIRPSDIKGGKEIIVDFRAEGNLEDYLKFIYNAQSSLSLLRIKKFQLNSRPNTDTLEASFSVSKLSVSN